MAIHVLLCCCYSCWPRHLAPTCQREMIKRGISVPIRVNHEWTSHAVIQQLVVQSMAAPGPSSAENTDYSDIEKHEFAQYILREHGTYFPKWGTTLYFPDRSLTTTQIRGYVRVRGVGTKCETTNRSVTDATHSRTGETGCASSGTVSPRCARSLCGAK